MLFQKNKTAQPSTFLFVYWGLAALLLALGVVQCGPQQTLRNDWQRMNFRGRVQLVEEWTYNGYDNFKRNRYETHTLNRFYPNGLLHKVGYYTPNEKEMYWSTFSYGQDSVWVQNTLEINGTIEHPQGYWLYLLNGQGEHKTIYSILLDSSLNYRAEVTFNQEGLPEKVTYEEVRHRPSVPCEVVNTYTPEGRLKEERIYIYDQARGQCATEPNWSRFTYNEEGYVEREQLQLYTGVEQLHSYQYLYDTVGNWTQRMHYQGDRVVGMTKRVLTYHP